MPLAFGGRNIDKLSLGYSVDVDVGTGAASLRVPVPLPPGRRGLAPSLVLAYSSGGGNSAFGAGWSLGGLPSIGLETRLHVPRWDGTDTYQLDGDELVPWLEKQENGEWTPRGFVAGSFAVTFLRGRRGAQVRVEKWVHVPTGRVHFRTRDARNVLTIYGARPDAAARIADPDDEARTFTWLPEMQIDPHGNVVWMEYAPETLDGLDRAAPWERRRPSLAQRYLKTLRYGNVAPLALDDTLASGSLPEGTRWCFHVALDYGDHGEPSWPARKDPFSSFRSGFEVRTYRLCRRFLVFHEFEELGAGPTLVGSLALTHDEDPAGSTLREVTFTGHRRDEGRVTSKSMPPLRMTYAHASSETSFAEAPIRTPERVLAGLEGRRSTFVDLLGEGLPGILTEEDRAWTYRQNLGGGDFGVEALVLELPATRPGAFGLGDVDQDGDTDLAQLAGRLAGRYQLDRETGAWSSFRPFAAFPHVEALGGRAQWVDVNGDGRADLVVAKSHSLVWFASDGDGFLPPVELPLPDGACAGASPDVFFADMTGDGLADMVRVQNGRVEYWPSLGNGRFGDRVLMDGAPHFATDTELDTSRVRFVDLDGSGTSDLVYLGQGEVMCWINASGNGLVPGPRLFGLPYLDNVSSVSVLDFLGDGRACLVWSSPLPGRRSPLEYLALTPADQPRLLLSVDDSMGRRTQLTYGSSAAHYLRDIASGRGWSTRLPSHRVVVDRREVLDQIGNTRLVQRFEYHDGYYDGAAREPRGFGQVDVYDAEAVDGTDPGPRAAAFTPPSLVRTWFHLGTPMWGRHRPTGTYAGDATLPMLPAHVVESEEQLSPEEIDDGLRMLAGEILRRETYAVGERDVPALHPFEVEQHGFRLRCMQPGRGSARPAFSVLEVEDATWVYEQTAGDPRVSHRLVVATDELDQPVRAASIAYARSEAHPRDIEAQGAASIQVDDDGLINIDEPGRFEIGIPTEHRRCELRGVRPGASGLVTCDQLTARGVTAALAAPEPHFADPPDDRAVGPRARLLSREQFYYWNDARSAGRLLREVGAPTLLHHEEAACFALGFIAHALGDRADVAGLTSLGYLQHDGLFWKSPGVCQYASADQFSLPTSIERADGAVTRIAHDAHALMTTAETDALGNTTTAIIDYHQLSPRRLTDPNGNVSAVRYDPLGVVVTATHHGHVDDHPWGFDPLEAVTARAPATLAEALTDPGRYLQGAARYVFYDLGAWSNDGMPTTILGLTREDLLHDGAGGGGASSRILVNVTYLDGFGRVLQEKTLVEGGLAIWRDAQGRVVVDGGGHPVLAQASPRWRGTGHVTYDDSKGHPAREHEPFFSASAAYEGDDVLQHAGPSTLTHYDALGRAVGQSFPDGTFTTTTYGAWTLEEADSNDNVRDSLYGARRKDLPLDDPERQAYEHAKAHAGTTRLTFLDPLGRSAGGLARGGNTAPDIPSETRLDIEGHPRAIIDPRIEPRGSVAFAYRRDMLGRQFHEHSIDAGDTWSLPDAHDRLVTTWNSRNFRIDRTYDAADRPLHTDVHGGDGATPLDERVEQWVYGESLSDQSDAARRNLLGRAVTTRDGAGEISIDRYDPAGRALSTTRRLRSEVSAGLEPFTTSTRYDALGRPSSDVLADGTSRTFEYLPSGPLSRVRITTPGGALTDVPILDGAAYGARGERRSLAYGNGVRIEYGYDPESRRLSTQTATRAGRRLQAIRYTHDPAGNLVRLTDSAQEDDGAVIGGSAVSARRDYAYDAHYRLLQATGRVHQALLPHDYIPGTKDTVAGTRHISLSNGAAIERFTQTYDYDTSGNLRLIKHAGKTRSWTRDMWVSKSSNRSLPALDPGGIALTDPEKKFDGRGNLRELSHLRRIEWTYRDEVGRCVITERPGGTDDAERYVYGGDGLRVRKVATRIYDGDKVEVTEKVYLGDTERKRITRGGKLVLERWTVHVSDGDQRIALVHRWVRDDLKLEVDDVEKPRIHYQINTHQGSHAIELGQDGRLISYEEYFPHGGTAFVAGDDLREVGRKECRYSGKECDGVTGLYYYGYRYYAPWMGRWLSPDPIGPEDDLNLYQFALGDPIGNVDDTGLETRRRRYEENWGELSTVHVDADVPSPAASAPVKPAQPSVSEDPGPSVSGVTPSPLQSRNYTPVNEAPSSPPAELATPVNVASPKHGGFVSEATPRQLREIDAQASFGVPVEFLEPSAAPASPSDPGINHRLHVKPGLLNQKYTWALERMVAPDTSVPNRVAWGLEAAWWTVPAIAEGMAQGVANVPYHLDASSQHLGRAILGQGSRIENVATSALHAANAIIQLLPFQNLVRGVSRGSPVAGRRAPSDNVASATSNTPLQPRPVAVTVAADKSPAPFVGVVTRVLDRKKNLAAFPTKGNCITYAIAIAARNSKNNVYGNAIAKDGMGWRPRFSGLDSPLGEGERALDRFAVNRFSFVNHNPHNVAKSFHRLPTDKFPKFTGGALASLFPRFRAQISAAMLKRHAATLPDGTQLIVSVRTRNDIAHALVGVVQKGRLVLSHVIRAEKVGPRKVYAPESANLDNFTVESWVQLSPWFNAK